jgi:PilZ domain.
MERREYIRIATDIASRLRLPNGDSYEGVTRELSFGGAYFDCHRPIQVPQEHLPLTEECELTLRLPLDQESVVTQIRCQLVHVENQKAGLRFTGIDSKAYARFRSFMLARSTNPEKFLWEIRLFPNPAFPRESAGFGFTAWFKELITR